MSTDPPTAAWRESDRCPCGSGASRAECCGPLLSGARVAATPEELMRSRYAAYVLGEVDYIVCTTLPEQRAGQDPAAIQSWAEDSTWLELEVLAVEGGGEIDEGFVEFRAHFESGCVRRVHAERSRFERREGSWYFDLEGSSSRETAAPRTPKPRRNDPCPCGSGKKFKKCCGS